MLAEIDILGHSFDVVRHGSLLKTAYDTSSFECVDFRRFCQIIANLARETLEEREVETTNLPWTQTERTMLQPGAEVGNVPVSQCCH